MHGGAFLTKFLESLGITFCLLGFAHVLLLLPFLWLEAANHETILWFRPGPGIGFAVPYAVQTLAFIIIGGILCIPEEETGTGVA